MSSYLYKNFYEYSRVIETVSLTEEGMYVKDSTPEDYGGSIMNVEVVHKITMVDSTGKIEVMHFENPRPKNKERTTDNSIYLDGTMVLMANDVLNSADRQWTTRLNTVIPQALQDAGKRMVELAKGDKNANGGATL